MERRTLTTGEMEKFTHKLAPYHMLRKEIDLAQAGELLTGYLNEWGTTKLAEQWGVKNYNIYDLRNTIRKEVGDDFLKILPRGKKETKTAVVKKTSPKKKPAANKTVYEKRIKELELQIKQQQAELDKKNRALEEQQAAPLVSEDIQVMLEFVEEQTKQVAAAVQEAQGRQQQNFSGIAFKFEGEYCADILKKRLGKVIDMIEGEPSTFDVTFHILEKERKDITASVEEYPSPAAVPEEILQTAEKTEVLQKQLDELTMNFLTWEEEMKAIKDATRIAAKWENGYNALKSGKEGLHRPKSEFSVKSEEKEVPAHSVITRHGIKCFQSFYVCSKCGDRGKTFTPKGSEFVNCKKCGEGMKKRDATDKGFPNVDAFGNVYIAGHQEQKK